MSKAKYITVDAKDVYLYPDYKVVSKYDKESEILICERSSLPIDKCENVECATLHTHKTRLRKVKTGKAVMQRKS